VRTACFNLSASVSHFCMLATQYAISLLFSRFSAVLTNREAHSLTLARHLFQAGSPTPAKRGRGRPPKPKPAEDIVRTVCLLMSRNIPQFRRLRSSFSFLQPLRFYSTQTCLCPYAHPLTSARHVYQVESPLPVKRGRGRPPTGDIVSTTCLLVLYRVHAIPALLTVWTRKGEHHVRKFTHCGVLYFRLPPPLQLSEDGVDHQIQPGWRLTL
jgi:hypothetical protein